MLEIDAATEFNDMTENMIKLGAYAERYSGVYGIYKAMLAAAPKYREQEK